MPVDDDPEVDQLSSSARSPRRAVLALVAVLLVAAVTVLIATRDGSGHDTAPRPTPSPAGSEDRSREHPEVVFLEHLDDCTTTDHRHQIRVAFGVTNIGRDPLRVLAADPILSDTRLVLRTVRFGAAPCAHDGSTRHVRLDASGSIVVAFRFRITDACPRQTLVAARVTFGSGDEILHAESAELGGLNRLRFDQCPAA